MTVDWMIGSDNNWCALDEIDFTSECFGTDLSGVYIVWFGADTAGHEGRVVCVGHGIIKNKLAALREDPTLARYSCRRLLVTWAEVEKEYQNSIEAYLEANLVPILGNHHTNAVQKIVNLPPW